MVYDGAADEAAAADDEDGTEGFRVGHSDGNVKDCKERRRRVLVGVHVLCFVEYSMGKVKNLAIYPSSRHYEWNQLVKVVPHEGL